MFEKSVYIARRKRLAELMKGKYCCDGVILFLGNAEAPQNYRGNDYKFRQESSFLYFWGLDEPMLAATIDLDSGCERLYGNDVDIDDIVWMGPQEAVEHKAGSIGICPGADGRRSSAYPRLFEDMEKAVVAGRKIHFLPQSRYYNAMTLSQLTGCSPELAHSNAFSDKDGGAADGAALNGVRPGPSLPLTRAVIEMRLVKEACEIEEIDKACEIGYLMHSTARRGCKAGVPEQEIVGAMEGATLSKGWGVSFTTILSQNGETLHNHSHNQIITPGRLLLVDAGAESNTHYASDFTRTYPCSGKFTPQQRDIYDIVQDANDYAFSLCRPDITYREVHIATVTRMLGRLKSLGLVNGDPAELAAEGIGGLFMPHGLGHNMGLDVHDMEDLGEDLVGYDDNQKREGGIGLANLRMARKLKPGNVITDEPGIYFIPALWEHFKAVGCGSLSGDAVKSAVNFARLERDYSHFGGIRLEDDVLITPTGARRLGTRRLPILAEDIESTMALEK